MSASLFSHEGLASSDRFRRFYYSLKPFVPKTVRMSLRRFLAHRIRKRAVNVWPIDREAAEQPVNWPGWPHGKQFAFVLSHDVEGPEGLARVHDLMKVEESLGFKSCFNLIPEGEYKVPVGLRRTLESQGFEVGVHDLRHDGKLYKTREDFRRNAERINTHLCDWGAVGFRSGFMLHNLEWLHDLEILYDSSTFDTDVFEPQPDGAKTIFPFWCAAKRRRRGYVELPYTLAQDSTLFLLLRERTNDIWKKKLKWLAENGGMAFLNVHPDYVAFNSNKRSKWYFDVEIYRDFLCHVKENYQGAYWHALPREVASYYHRWEKSKTQETRISEAQTETGTEVLVNGHGSPGTVLTLGTLSTFAECIGSEVLNRMAPLL